MAAVTVIPYDLPFPNSGNQASLKQNIRRYDHSWINLCLLAYISVYFLNFAGLPDVGKNRRIRSS